MAATSTELIVLASTKTGEKSVVVHTLSSVWGRRSFICSVSGRSGMSLFLPLNILEAEITENPRSELWRMHSISVLHPLGGIRGDIFRNTMTLFMSEVLYRTVKDGANEDGLFEWCRKSILTLDALDNDSANFHLRFLLEFAGILGFEVSAENLKPFAGKHFEILELLLKLDFAHFLTLPLNGESRNEIAESLLKYLSYHTEAAIDVKSLPVLREIYR